MRITLAKSLENAGFTEGLIDKSEFIGSTSDRAELALATYERQIGHSLTATEILTDTNEILKTLISTENELFQDKISRFGENILPLYYDKYYGKPHRYIHMEELMAALLKTYDDIQNNNLNVVRARLFQPLRAQLNQPM